MSIPRYNVIWIVTDDQPFDAYDHMPYLASNPEGSWVDFPNSVNTCPICGPSRITMLTGFQARRTRNARNDYAPTVLNGGIDEDAMIGSVMQGSGYYTAFIGKYINGFDWDGIYEGEGEYVPGGWDRFVYYTPNTYYNFRPNVNGVQGGIYNSGEYRTDIQFADCINEFDRAQAQGRRAFIILAPQAPHRQGGDSAIVPAVRHEDLEIEVEETAAFNEADISDKPLWLRNGYPNPMTTEQIDDAREEHLNALRAMRAIDEGMESLIEHLDDVGQLENTVIMFWGDNGNLYGEHRHRFGKGVPYREALRLGLRVRWPGVDSRTDTSLVTHADAAATTVKIAGAAFPNTVDGMSFHDLVIEPSTNWRDVVLIERDTEIPTSSYRSGTFTVALTETWKYVEHLEGTGFGVSEGEGGDKELYDLVNDPYELVNVAGTGLDIEGTLASQLAILQAQQIAPDGA